MKSVATVQTVLLPYTSGEIGGSHISGTALGVGLAEGFGIRSIVVAPAEAQVLSLARTLDLETLESGEPVATRHAPHRDLIRTPARIALLRRFPAGTLVHCNDISALQSWILAARFTGTPIVHHNRGFTRDILPYRALMRMADHVIAISAACESRLQFLPIGRRSIVTNPFSTPTEYDGAATRAELLAALDAPPDTQLIGFAGNLWKRKRPELFVEIAARLSADNPRLRFAVFGRAGDISIEDLNEHISRVGLTGRVLMAGFRLPPEANLAALDLLLMPAINEPFGRTLVEALLLGIPYVAADDAGHSEIHRRWGGGRLVARDASVETYASACREVLDGANAVALPLAERKAIAASLAPARHAADVLEIYRGLMR